MDTLLHTEAREEQLVNATHANFTLLARAVLNGEPVATKRVTDALGEFLADDQACAELVRNTLRHDRGLTAVLNDLLWNEAIQLAEAAMTAAEQRRVQSCADNRIAMAECDRWMAA
jgi:hypothetical protein